MIFLKEENELKIVECHRFKSQSFTDFCNSVRCDKCLVNTQYQKHVFGEYISYIDGLWSDQIFLSQHESIKISSGKILLLFQEKSII